ncbi:MAG: hypothetical protein VX009_01615 [Pseudomonadota bacterium]|nr:hypothetical protein [Pseudomonadota bacterium]
MIKRLLVNSIKDVLGEILIKKQKKDLFNYQRIVASSISKNKTLNIPEEKNFETSDSENELEVSKVLLDKVRGVYDFNALKERYKDTKIYNYYCPTQESKKKIFEIISIGRCLKLGFEEFIGCKKNIQKSFKKLNIFFNYKLDKKNALLLNTIVNVFESKKTKYKNFKKFYPELSLNDLKELKKFLSNQELYFIKANEIIKKITIDEEHKNNQNLKNEDQKKTNNTKSKKKENKKIPFYKNVNTKKKKQTEINSTKDFFEKKEINDEQYNIFTKEFDLSVSAKKLATKSELNLLRKKFENEYNDNKRLINRLAKKLERLFSSLNTNSWKFDQEEGYIDPSRLANLVANTKNLQIFKCKNENIEKNTVVSLLLDNSGSMRGKPIITSAITTEIITKVLEKCKVNVEVLGFTTKEWKGGRSKKKWETEGKIEKPGRLNDLLHIIYKDADSTWNNCKNNLGLILKDGLLKENIDGEALQWAYKRLMNRKEKKKILIVISDGAPVDDSTLSNNPPNILDNHLKETVIRIQNSRTIKLVAIGIGHDVSKYYKNAFIIEDAENLGDIIIDNLMKFLGTKNI